MKENSGKRRQELKMKRTALFGTFFCLVVISVLLVYYVIADNPSSSSDMNLDHENMGSTGGRLSQHYVSGGLQPRSASKSQASNFCDEFAVSGEISEEQPR